MKLKTDNSSKFVIHPLFLLLSIVFVALGEGFYFVNILLVVVLHEYAHYFVAKALGYKLKQICLLPYGAQLNLSKSIFNSNDEIKIALAGPLFNLVLATICIAIWWLFPMTYIYTEIFVRSNLVIALFNLLPLTPLDGSRVVLAVLNRFGKRNLGYKIISVMNVVTSFFFFVLFILSAFGEINLTLALMSLFIFMGAFEKDESYMYSSLFSFSKQKSIDKTPMKVKFYAMRKIDKLKVYKLINQNYYLVIVLLDENMKPTKFVYESDFDKYFIGN